MSGTPERILTARGAWLAARDAWFAAAVRDWLASVAAHEARRLVVNRLWLEYLELAEPVRAPIIRRLLKHDMKDAGMPADELFPEDRCPLGLRILDMNSEICTLVAEEERILASFTQRLIEIAAVSGAHETASSPIAALNAMRLPAIALDQHGLVADVNAAADAVFDQNINIKDSRLFVRNPDARTLLEKRRRSIEGATPALDSLALDPVIVRIWPFDGPAHQPGQEVRAILTLNACGAKARTVRGDPRQDIPADTIGSEGRLHHRAWSSSRYRRPRIAYFPGDGAQSVEIRFCQDGHASPKRAGRVAFASRVTNSR